MQSFVRRLGLLSVVMFSCLTFLGWFTPVHAEYLSGPSGLTVKLAATYSNPVDSQLASDSGKKLDLNNASTRVFSQYKGMYPTLAGLIVQNAPYEAVEDVLDIPGLTDAQVGVLSANLDNFTVTDPNIALNSGDDRYNDGSYNPAIR